MKTRFFRHASSGSEISFGVLGVLLVSTLAFLPVSADAQTPEAQPKNVFSPAPLFSPRDITTKTLPSGLQSVVKVAPGFDLVSIQVWVKSGSRFEKSGESGVAHLVETAVTRGSKNHPATESPDESGFLGAVRSVGGDGGALTSRDATFYSATVAPNYFARTLGAMADAVIRPDLSPEAIEEAKLSASDDITRRNFDPVSLASDLAYANSYAKHPYRNSALGSQASLGKLTMAQARDYHARQYVGKNITVVVCGKVSSAEAHAAIERAFKDVSNKTPVALALPADPFSGKKEMTRRTIVPRDALVLAWRSPGIDKAIDVAALDTLLALWSEGLDANLRTALLRDGEEGPNKPLVSGYDVDFLTQRDPGLFMISLSGINDREGAISTVLKEVKRVRDNPLPDAEFLRAKAQLRQQYMEQGENAVGQAGALGFYSVIASHQFAVDYLSLCAKVTKADLQRVARTYLTEDKIVQTEVVPLPRPREEDDGLQQNPVITIGFEQNFETGATR
jgi:zinc protease